jgi:hypothetical protein
VSHAEPRRSGYRNFARDCRQFIEARAQVNGVTIFSNRCSCAKKLQKVLQLAFLSFGWASPAKALVGAGAIR